MKQNQLKDKLIAFVKINWYFPSVREFQKECSYKSPRSVQLFYESLEKEWFISRITPKKFVITKNATKIIFKIYIDSLNIEELKMYNEYIDSRINLILCEQNLALYAESHTQTQWVKPAAHYAKESTKLI